MPFRDEYQYVKEHLADLEDVDPAVAIARKTHLGATAGLDWPGLRRRITQEKLVTSRQRRYFQRKIDKLMAMGHGTGD